MGPDRHENGPEHRPFRADEEQDFVEPEPDQERVEDAVAQQDPLPDQRHDDRGQQHGKEKHRAKEAPPADLAVQDQRGDQREHDHQSDLEENEGRGVVDALPEPVLAARGRIDVVRAIEQEGVLLGLGIGSVCQV